MKTFKVDPLDPRRKAYWTSTYSNGKYTGGQYTAPEDIEGDINALRILGYKVLDNRETAPKPTKPNQD